MLLGDNEKNSVLASIEFIIKNSVRFDVPVEILLQDLISLGLPKENCGSIAKIYKKNKAALMGKMIQTSMRGTRRRS